MAFELCNHSANEKSRFHIQIGQGRGMGNHPGQRLKKDDSEFALQWNKQLLMPKSRVTLHLQHLFGIQAEAIRKTQNRALSLNNTVKK